MSDLIPTVLSLIEKFLPLIPTGGSATAGAVITTLEKVIPLVGPGIDALSGPIKNIVAQLVSGGAVTPAQIAQLKALDARIDAAVDASMQGLDPDAAG